MMSSRQIESALKAARVLVIEDSPFMQQLLTAMLRAIGVGHVQVTRDGESALKMFDIEEFDCAVVDWLMHPMTGYEFLQEIRRHSLASLRQTPVIMCSAYTDRERVVQMRDAGANEIVAKPVSPSNLYDRLVRALFNPRPFIDLEAYIGPDRRRRQIPISFPERRLNSRRGASLDHVTI